MNETRTVKTVNRQVTSVKIGDKFGSLEVVEDLGLDKNRHHYYNCVCKKCGSLVKISKKSLIKEAKCPNCGRIIDYSGKIIGNYKVLYPIDKRTVGRNAVWLCECLNCGTKLEISSNCISSGKMIKCNCEKKHSVRGNIFDYFPNTITPKNSGEKDMLTAYITELLKTEITIEILQFENDRLKNIINTK